jgi:hypothetical protein
MSYRNLKAINRQAFREDLEKSALLQSPPEDVDELVETYNSVLTTLLDKHAPQKTKTLPDRAHAPWINEDVLKARQARRRAERAKRKSQLTIHTQIYRQARLEVAKAIRRARTEYFQRELEDAGSDSRKMFSLLDSLLHRKTRAASMPDMDSQMAADKFSAFFVEKIEKIRQTFQEPDDALTPLFVLSLFSNP